MPDGSIMHAEVRIEDTVVIIADGVASGRPSHRCYMFTSRMSTLPTNAHLRSGVCRFSHRPGGKAIRIGEEG